MDEKCISCLKLETKVTYCEADLRAAAKRLARVDSKKYRDNLAKAQILLAKQRKTREDHLKEEH